MAAAAGRHGGVNTPSFHSGGGGRGRHGQLGGACEQSVRAVVVGLTATGAAVVTDCMHGAAAVAAVTTVSAWAAVVLVRPHSLWYSALLFLLARAEAPCTTQGVITAAPCPRPRPRGRSCLTVGLARVKWKVLSDSWTRTCYPDTCTSM